MLGFQAIEQVTPARSVRCNLFDDTTDLQQQKTYCVIWQDFFEYNSMKHDHDTDDKNLRTTIYNITDNDSNNDNDRVIIMIMIYSSFF